MLVLTRKKQETIRIGDNITVTVLRIKGKSVRLGIEAPLQQSVLRGELTAFETDETVCDFVSKSETDTPLPGTEQSTEDAQWRRLPAADPRELTDGLPPPAADPRQPTDGLRLPHAAPRQRIADSRRPKDSLRQDAAATLRPTAPLKSLVRSRGDARVNTGSVLPRV